MTAEEEFQSLWKNGNEPPDIVAFLTQRQLKDVADWLAVLRTDQDYRWKTSEPLRVEDYLIRLPQLPQGVDWKLQLAIGEFEARRETTRPLSEAEISSRFPELTDTLRERLKRSAVDDESQISSGRIDDLCDRFESAWMDTDRSPMLEEFLAEVPAASQSDVFAGLLQIELWWRRQRGQTPAADVYASRFPDRKQQIDDLLKAPLASSRRNQRPAEYVADDPLQPTQIGSLDGQSSTVTYITSAGIGVQQKGRYRLDRVLGEGAFGRVYLGYDEDLLRQVAIKVPTKERFRTPDDAESYLAEARTVAGLDHPNIVPVYDMGRSQDGSVYVVSRYVDGSTLQNVISEARPGQREAAVLMATVARALDHAHGKRLIHRDVKPANILIDGSSGTPFVADFGLAIREEDYLKENAIAGTPAYMSPEQAQGEGHRLDGRSDLFSLGVILYELLTGSKPFRGSSPLETLHKVTTENPQPPRERQPEISPELERICLKALSKRASDRYGSAGAFAEDLDDWLKPKADSEVKKTDVSIVPRGLRSFGAEDADFFLDLLPGPRNRDGLPESLAFWKQRIEECDPDLTFTVGLIYGPSGCGKSSLVKAGLLPHLSQDVTAVYVEATPDETELRILRAVRKRRPQTNEKQNLAETLKELRRGEQKKIVIIIDQFEQWLHAHRSDTDAELVRALRQCDGGTLQAVLMIRDDFAMAASRLMRALDTRILEGHNFATVDLFDEDHACRVLIKFGQAFGRLPAQTDKLSDQETSFVETVASGLAQDGKVVSVRLALFAEMVKSKPWIPQTLVRVGGTQGIGVNFLEETFHGRDANPDHRLHAEAVREVLKALLPEVGSDIKGHMRSHGELQQACGYQNRPDDFDDLVRILDGQLRLITPTDPEGIQTESGSDPSAKYYQLTHDYLVPSLREWLTRKQQETRKGRAELKLDERTALWTAKPENRHLPSLAEWTAIRTLTDRPRWTAPQQAVMQRAGRVHGTRIALGLTASVLLLVGGLWTKGRVDERQAKTSASGLVAALLSAETRDVPQLVSNLAPYRQWADPELQAALKSTDAKSQLHARVALLPVDTSQVQPLQNALLDATPENVLVLRELLQASGDQIAESYWPILQSSKTPDQQRLAAGAALARFAPDDDRWKEVAGSVSQLLVNENPLRLATWIEAFRPVRAPLIPELSIIFRDQTDAVTPTQRELATSLLETYAADDLAQLSELILDANPKQFVSLFDELQSHGDAAIANLETEINRVLTPQWDDPPLDAAWTEPPNHVVQVIQRAAGIITERFAFCQTLPLSDFQTVADLLGKSGYRPVRLRPYAHQRTVQVAAAWTRDGRDWRVETKAVVDSILDKDETQRNDGFVAVDVAGYLGEQEGQSAELYAAVWVERQNSDQDARIYAGVSFEKHEEAYGELEKAEYQFQQALQGFRGLDGNQLYCGVKSNSGGGGVWSWNQTVAELDAEQYVDEIHWDIDPSRAAVPESTQQRNEKLLVDAEAKIKQNSEDLNARFARGEACFYLGQNEKALADMGHIVQMAPALAWAYQFRSILYARLGDTDAARFDLQHFAERNASETLEAYLNVVVSAYLGDEAEAIKRLELLIEKNQDNVVTLYDSACAYSVASGVYEEQDVTRA
ncbi:MAG: protein kinase [Planctomycetaceae bacterium]